MRCRKLLLFLSALGLVVAVVALYEYVIFSRGLATGPSFCNISQKINCDLVNASSWSSFFGLPIASYGIFFYLSLIGLLYASGPGRTVHADVAKSVTLVAALVASLVSLALFGVSKFIIGAYCLLCLGLYIINFLLLGACCYHSREIGFMRVLRRGCAGLAGFVVQALKGKRAYLMGMAMLAIIAGFSALSPQIVFAVASRLSGRSVADGPQLDVAKALRQWQEAPVVAPSIDTTGGAFADYAQGVQDAPIQIVEFADFECPGCRKAYVGLDSLLKKYQGRYRLVFKNYPLDSACNPSIRGAFHTMACFAAHFTRCAGEQGKFWEALDFVFTDPVLEDVEDTPASKVELLEKGSQSLGLDQQAVEECVHSERHLRKIQSDVTEGERLGLESTPSYWVNGRKVPQPSNQVFSAIFEMILDQSKSSD